MARFPAVFCAQIAEHNRSCWIAAALSLGCAGVAWAIAGVIYAGLVLLFGGLGPMDALKLPQWFFPVGLCGVVVLLALAVIDRKVQAALQAGIGPADHWKTLDGRPVAAACTGDAISLGPP